MATAYLSCIVVIATVVSTVCAWPNFNVDRWSHVSRRSDFKCIGSAGKCYATHECCGGFVCAVFDDYLAQKDSDDQDENPEIPGNCVKEKDLTECTSTYDCPVNHMCMTLSSTGDKYCIKRHRAQKIQIPSSSNQRYDFPNKGGLGSHCDDDSDCKQYTSDGRSKLCCQTIKRGRQGLKTICDRISPISVCIGGK